MLGLGAIIIVVVAYSLGICSGNGIGRSLAAVYSKGIGQCSIAL